MSLNCMRLPPQPSPRTSCVFPRDRKLGPGAEIHLHDSLCSALGLDQVCTKMQVISEEAGSAQPLPDWMLWADVNKFSSPVLASQESH